MTDEQINVAIAEACGWEDRGSFNHDRPDDHLFRKKTVFEKFEFKWQHEFNYCNDLNAMHEAEKFIDDDKWSDYFEYIGWTWGEVIHSTARQRAEAFLRTLGKWKEVAE